MAAPSSNTDVVAGDLKAWAEKWDTGKTRWKNEEKHQQHAKNYEFLLEKLKIQGSLRVLVPLAGDSPVVSFLVSKGHKVVAVEYVEAAVKKLMETFEDHKTFTKSETKAGPCYQSTDNTVTIVQGDFYLFEDKAPFDLIYDRASLVAIEPEKRELYAQILRKSLKKDGHMFLEVVGGKKSDPLSGPPYMVKTEVVKSLYCDDPKAGKDWKILDFQAREEEPTGFTLHRYLIQRPS